MKKFCVMTMLLFVFLLASCEAAQHSYSPFRAKEINRDGDYKKMEMYVYDDDEETSRRITFEVPVEWNGEYSVISIVDENDRLIMKVDMWSVNSAKRENVLIEYNDRYSEMDEVELETIDENIYSTEKYEIFYYKVNYGGDPNCIFNYYLYANGERFHLTGYLYVEDKPENDEIFKRIAESVTFQF